MKVYCKNCKKEKNKDSTYTMNYTRTSGHTGPYSVSGCGYEKINITETGPWLSIVPYRNRENDCKGYERKWWKFWVKNGRGNEETS